MYARFFGLKREPFSIAPDPRYLYMSDRHREALAHLLYGVKGGGGFVLLTGEIGAGKTTVCRCFLEQIPPRCNVAYIFNPKLTVDELLKSICDEFRIPMQASIPGMATVKDYVDALNEFLLKTHSVGQNNVLIIDEAQNLSADVLEQLRLLTNLETNERKLLQIILIGQPELRTMLARPELEQMAQRVIARFHLDALSPKETTQYIRHRMAVAGMTRAFPFDANAIARIHELSRGIPRRINLLCDRALLGAYGNQRPNVDRTMVEKASQEVFGVAADGARLPWSRNKRWAVAGGGIAACVALLGVGTVAMDSRHGAPTAAAPNPAASATRLALAAPSASAAAPDHLAAASAPPAAIAKPAASAPAPAVSLATGVKSAIHSERDAWRELAPAWDLKLGDGDPCQLAGRAQVECFRSTSSNLALIRQLARPGIISVRDESDKTGFAVLTGLGTQTATLSTGGVTQTVSLATLASMWKGDYATFFRVPPGYVNKVVDAETGPMAEWLSAQLAKVDGAPQGGPLRPRVSAFQLAQGLKADGLAGPTTFMQLNRAMGIPEPRLSAER
ncbi:ExeA family protein [Piscinibacter terrae]|uniref:Peptidoglycan-binding protein n=1 Tax=Piscinibacter terrae TaxID=2496871 RepID=A0A3N7HUR5_9BURK|nr:AAA family ATPase [Albitalea terrae]RQP26077.1 peptidoglycan-binding protein [Albitalea terrae]